MHQRIAWSCRRYRRQIHLRLDGKLTPAEESALAEHLAGCPACQREWETLRATVDFVAAAPEPTLRPRFAARVQARLDARRAESSPRPARLSWRPVAVGLAVMGLISVAGWIVWQARGTSERRAVAALPPDSAAPSVRLGSAKGTPSGTVEKPLPGPVERLEHEVAKAREVTKGCVVAGPSEPRTEGVRRRPAASSKVPSANVLRPRFIYKGTDRQERRDHDGAKREGTKGRFHRPHRSPPLQPRPAPQPSAADALPVTEPTWPDPLLPLFLKNERRELALRIDLPVVREGLPGSENGPNGKETSAPIRYVLPTLPTDPGQYVICAPGVANAKEERLDREGPKEREGAKHGGQTKPQTRTTTEPYSA